MQWNDRIGRRLKLRDLHILLAVVQRGSMAKAANDLAISQPAVSKAITDVEHTLGLRLLDRSRNGIEPTVYGRALVKRGVAIFDELKQGVKELEFLADPTAGEIRIGTTPPLAASFVSAIIDQFSRRYPRVVFDVVTGTSEAMRRNLTERNVDLLILRERFPVDEQLNFEFLFDSPYVVAVDANSLWARRRRIKLAQLVDELWVLPRPNIAFGLSVADAFCAIGLGFPRTTVFADGHELRISLLRTGRYLTVLPEFLLQFSPPHPFIKILPVELPIARGPVGIIAPKNRTLSPIARLFIEQAHDVAKPLAKHRR